MRRACPGRTSRRGGGGRAEDTGNGDTAMTRVAVSGCWAKLCCTPRLWEALSAVSTETGWQVARQNGPPRRVAASALWPSGPLALWHSCLRLCLCPCSVLVAASGPTMQAMSSRRDGSGIAGRTHPLVWVCPTGERGSTDSVAQSPVRKVYPASHM